MRILGIDPGTGRTGWGVVDNPKGIELKLVDYGCLETPKEMELPKRLVMIRTQLIDLLTKTKPDVVAIEQLFFGVNAMTAMSVGQARGVVIETLEEHGYLIKEYQGLTVKLTLTGSGKAKKPEIGAFVKTALGLDQIPKPDDAADALGVAICHVFKVNNYKTEVPAK